SPLAVVRAAAVIAQPEPDEVTLARRLRPVAEARPLVRDLPVVDELHLPRLEVEVHAEIFAIPGAVPLAQRPSAPPPARPPPALRLEAGEPAVQPARVDLEDRVMRDHDVIGGVLALASEVEGLVQAREDLGTSAPDLVVRRGEAHDAAHSAFHGRVEAEQSHVLGWAEVVAIVRVEALLGVGDVG